MSGNEPNERKELTDEDRRIADEALEQLHRDLAAASGRPPVEVRSPGKFDGPLGMLDDGTFQQPLTEEEKQHNEEVRRRARDENGTSGWPGTAGRWR
jgi:hypothetical protein